MGFFVLVALLMLSASDSDVAAPRWAEGTRFSSRELCVKKGEEMKVLYSCH